MAYLTDAQLRAFGELYHLAATERDHWREQSGQWEETATKCAEEAERLRADNGYLQRQIEEFKAVHTRLTEQLVEARKQIPETVDTGGKT